jgi:hypothetical protein
MSKEVNPKEWQEYSSKLEMIVPLTKRIQISHRMILQSKVIFDDETQNVLIAMFDFLEIRFFVQYQRNIKDLCKHNHLGANPLLQEHLESAIRGMKYSTDDRIFSKV